MRVAGCVHHMRHMCIICASYAVCIICVICHMPVWHRGCVHHILAYMCASCAGQADAVAGDDRPMQTGSSRSGCADHTGIRGREEGDWGCLGVEVQTASGGYRQTQVRGGGEGGGRGRGRYQWVTAGTRAGSGGPRHTRFRVRLGLPVYSRYTAREDAIGCQ